MSYPDGWGNLLSLTAGMDDSANFFYSGIYIGGYYTTDYTDSMIVLAVSKNNGTYAPPVILKDSESGYNWNNNGVFSVKTPQGGKTYKYFHIRIV